MRVLIDCTQVSLTKVGVGAYAVNLVRELVAFRPDELELLLIVQDDDPDFFIREPGVTVIKVPARLFRKLPMRFLLEQLYIPWLVVQRRIHVVHSLHYAFPLAPMAAAKVVTVHDLTSFKFPNMHVASKGRYYRFFLRASRRRANHLAFVSQSTLGDYLAMFPRDIATCHVTRLGKGPEFHRDLDPLRLDSVMQKYELRRPFILFIGMLEPRKNVARLVDAFARVAADFPAYSLVIAGKKGWMYESIFESVRKSGLHERVVFTGFVSEQDKPYIIRGADIFVYPSIYEGFGLPVLEAMASGTPCITSNTSSMPEVAGDAALLIDPNETDSLVAALKSMLADSELRADLAAKGIEQARKFNWKQTAVDTYEVYQKAITSQHH